MSQNTWLSKESQEEVLNRLNSRYIFSVFPIHCAAALLDPSCSFLSDKEDDRTLNLQEESTANAFIADFARHTGEHVSDILQELMEYKTRSGKFVQSYLWEISKETEPILWWQGLCPPDSLLRKLAIRILQAPSTSSSVERSFSIQGWYQSKIKNRLTNERTEKKAFIKFNLQSLNVQTPTTHSVSDTTEVELYNCFAEDEEDCQCEDVLDTVDYHDQQADLTGEANTADGDSHSGSEDYVLLEVSDHSEHSVI